mmetsp:Transcript_71502/g.149498  ORF Transcript_71502/g.149498 Transcript_71502/m.149498 type:complete len:173 (+) Transcript_71502:414-932(+)|eukprot:CAMPEP_0206442358 /NCGR_PEP_ID=MMETSP0324_2-20121206/13780_1 /ASSEMBLY_ACC=CAM_ASM_000836 /TAXON_ID=2866 /ORGANISM="Crypthecodinium cohnii, Strain Seligo" /LENGTH=172 /DNA_ID=CAMNT_0053910197 /DNA_START=408 /DNA_END=926 /DNA_ORIENTATION=-
MGIRSLLMRGMSSGSSDCSTDKKAPEAHMIGTRSGGSLLLGRLFAVGGRGDKKKRAAEVSSSRSQSASRLANIAASGRPGSSGMGGTGSMTDGKSDGSEQRRQVHVDGDTVLPEDVYRSMLRMGSEARARGQHIVQERRFGFTDSSRESRGPRLVRASDDDMSMADSSSSRR